MKINTVVLLALLLSGCSAGPNKVTYPFRANELRIGGNVSVLYNIDEDGRASNIRILSAEPKNYFERSIKQDVSEWHFAKNNPRKDVRLDVQYRLD
ncbi:TonB family protein [Rahnella bonaserana]|jgi:protein TonB|uniref:TonB family protein n=1 Tax=Rahnella bonaserana TaxID=2816248 RepID=UPI00320897FE